MRTPTAALILSALALGLASESHADPCGMVPPIALGPSAEIQRDGAQRTYVMFKDGVETIALRPGFTGNVDEFGMLIPFPSPPALRKIDDDTFSQLENAIDPPDINVYVYDQPPYALASRSRHSEGFAAPAAVGDLDDGLRFDEVKVLNQEAVGMYQVAVLEAGSPKALQRWMDDNGYRYPKGMDDVTQDYVDARWCFVAIKAKVGQMPGVSPRPGMRSVTHDLPQGASFDGHVQGMGFRFRVEEPVVPMRLSVFNGRDPRNVVYMLTDEPVKLAGVSQTLVKRQVSGEELMTHLTGPLDLVWHTGAQNDLDSAQWAELQAARSPEPYVGVARDLFAADLLSLRTGELSLPVEELEKDLLRVSEDFGLRGDAIDDLHAQALRTERDRALEGALDDVREMTLTVIDGVLPHSLLARENLTFTHYDMPDGRNNRRQDAIAAPDQTRHYFRGGGGWVR